MTTYLWTCYREHFTFRFGLQDWYSFVSGLCKNAQGAGDGHRMHLTSATATPADSGKPLVDGQVAGSLLICNSKDSTTKSTLPEDGVKPQNATRYEGTPVSSRQDARQWVGLLWNTWEKHSTITVTISESTQSTKKNIKLLSIIQT